MDLPRFLMQSKALEMGPEAQRFASFWKPAFFKKGSCLAHQGDPDAKEHIVLEGRVVGSIFDPDGRAICVGLYSGPCVITPNIARTRDGISRVSLEAKTDSLVMQIASQTLLDLMLASEPIRDWANDILRVSLERKAEREWCLAALSGVERLAWFRKNYPDHEAIFTHSVIASFLGMTPVTFSRLRHANRA